MKKEYLVLYLWCCMAAVTPATGQSVLFDFDNAPLYSSLPVSQSAGGITATLTATGQGYSIQQCNVMGFTPAGFSGRIVYPNSIYLSDLLIHFDQLLEEFSIMYSCQELGCDDAAIMRVTAYNNHVYVGTATKTAANPGTWPVDTLKCNFLQGFDSVVVHYDSHPLTCQDYGVIFLADNMRVKPSGSTAIPDVSTPGENISIPNPVRGPENITLTLAQTSHVNIVVCDLEGRQLETVFDGLLQSGPHTLIWNAAKLTLKNGIYIMVCQCDNFRMTQKFCLLSQ